MKDEFSDILSPRERDVVGLLLQGMSNKQIALGLGVSERTVEFHLNNIYGKLQVASRVELILKLGKPTGGNSGDPVESTVEHGAEILHNGNQSARPRAAYSWRNTFSLIKKEVAMTIYVSFEGWENYLRNKPLLFGVLMFLAASLSARYVMFEQGLYFWGSYLLLGLLLGAGSLRFGRILKNGFPSHPLLLIAFAVLLPLLAIGFDQLYLNTILRFTDPISVSIANLSTRAEWLTSADGNLYRSTHISATSDLLWFITIAYMLVVFFFSRAIGNRSNNQKPATT